jgi:hypothetical protein
MTTTAHDVVAEYLRDKAEHDRPREQRDLIARRTLEIVDELPDGFTKRDVQTCVRVLTANEPVLDDMTAGKRARTITKTLNDLVADDTLRLEGDTYTHAVSWGRTS